MESSFGAKKEEEGKDLMRVRGELNVSDIDEDSTSHTHKSHQYSLALRNSLLALGMRLMSFCLLLC